MNQLFHRGLFVIYISFLLFWLVFTYDILMPKKPHADSKKKDILRAAMRLFATKGIDGISVKQLGDAAGVTDAAIYKHFRSKDEVALVVFEQYCTGYTAMIDLYISRSGTFISRFHQLIDEVLTIHDEDQYGLLLLSQHHELYAEASRNSPIRQPIDALSDLIEQGVRNGELPDQNVRLSAVLLDGMFTRMAVSSLQGELPSQLKPLASEVKERFSALLGANR